MSEAKHLSRSIDHLGDLGAKLRDLQGFATLAFELIQNADDVPGATAMSFDVCEDALIVDNNGVFSECPKVEEYECPWKSDQAIDHRCDFHRFRRIASGDKRREADTTGAFGIGFIAVYQITDTPELISAGRHWILQEDKPEDQRIEVCPGCAKCRASDLPGTRFILPWAHDSNSPMRKGLQAEPVSPDAQQRFLNELEQTLPIAMLFLKRITNIEVKWNGCIRHSFKQEKDRLWYMIEGDFAEIAGTLRAKHPQRIEEKKSAKVTLAIPINDDPTGLLCAYLPTQQNTKLPFHINADFFTTNDRKRIHLADGFQSEWNRAALKAAAYAMANSIERLTTLLGPKRFWGFLNTLKQVADLEHGEPTYAEFWKAVEPRLKAEKIVYTTKDEWIKPHEAILLSQKEEAFAISVLEAMDFNIVNEDLRPYQTLLRLESIGVPLLDIGRLCIKLTTDGLIKRTETTNLPVYLSKKAFREGLWAHISLLLERQQRTLKVKEEDENRLRKVALAPGSDGALWPCSEINKADKETVLLFQSCGNAIPFVGEDPAFSSLSYLCRRFDAAAAIQILMNIDGNVLESAWHARKLDLVKLFGWFENNKKDILENTNLRHGFAGLPIFPSSGKLHQMNALVLPGDFIDNLQLAEIVDLTALGGRREFLQDLQMQVLDFRTYVLSLIPLALSNESLNTEKRRSVVTLLAKRLGEIKDDQEVQNTLVSLSLIECTDGKFRKASQCYFESASVNECLANGVHFVLLRDNDSASIHDLYNWLGVASKPRPADLLERIKNISGLPYTADNSRIIEKIFMYLGKTFHDELPAVLSDLTILAWLPARGKQDRWYRPGEIYAVFQSYLFESQALFLDIPQKVQQDSSQFLNLLAIKTAPSIGLIVKHILYCCDKGLSVHRDVYRVLNDKADDPALNQLSGKKCLNIGNAYLSPNQVFWGDHPFGRYRQRLSDELRSHNNFMQKIGVRDVPNHEDALKVLDEIAKEFGNVNMPLDDEAHAVLLLCWRMIEKAYDAEKLSAVDIAVLNKQKCIANADKLLYPPEWIYFENRAGLAAKFDGFLKGNVIPKPLGAARAMIAAGVRTLGSAVEIQLLDCANPSEDSEMSLRVVERKNQFGRVIESQMPGSGTITALQRLEALQCMATTSLMIRYHLNTFNRTLDSQPESVPALYQRAPACLYFVKKNGRTASWSAIARELAIALFPEEDPGKIAAGIKEVLAAESAADATATLNELGFAGLDTVISETPEARPSATSLGNDVLVGEMPPSTADDLSLPNKPSPETAADAVESILGKGTRPPTKPITGLDSEPVRVGGGKSKEAKSSAGKKSTRPVLRSYVPSPDAKNDVSTGSDDGEDHARNHVDIAGVRHVLDYETNTGRIPKEMPHKNPGYDVESRNAKGEVERYIEIKSLSGRWNHSYATLSRPQFDKATSLGDAFWLYVVENAESDNYQVHRIQNPALKANHFMFDDGWRSVAEIDDQQTLGDENTGEENED